ncbi:Sec-independent protein translocase protein TatA [Allocatelliglobosispora scoriae]|uniref:Sec-independent protein translocase protein TatA n=1 Tax=Allocatelliglobosispora scoriae TaxID=643052 RepID=A0A841BLG0_9ACTN|nr:SHOCT domain-containing protein [Allocatelliglobosispora scoriae]MBB5867582.1 Sec-independent protein translocase protein TatA [Allocatelliglobosispora scoriae]
MEAILPVVIVLVIVAIVLGNIRDSSLAKKVGREVGAQKESDDPVVLLEKLHQLRMSGALTDEEYRAQKERILRNDR